MSDSMDENVTIQESTEDDSNPKMMIDEKDSIEQGSNDTSMDPDTDMKDDSPASPECDNTGSIGEPIVGTIQSSSPPTSPAIPDRVPNSEQSSSQEISQTIQSPSHDPFVVLRGHVHVFEAPDSAQSPDHDAVDSNKSPVYEPSDSAQSPVHEMDEGLRCSPPEISRNHDHIQITSREALDCPLSPRNDTSTIRSPSPSNEPVENGQSPPSFQGIPDSAQSPAHEIPDVAPQSPLQETIRSTPENWNGLNELSQEAPVPMEEEAEDVLNTSGETHEDSSQETKDGMAGSASEEEIDLEDGEIEDDEEEDTPVIIKEEIKSSSRSSSSKLETPSAVIASILPESESKSRSSKSKGHSSRDKSKEKDGKSSKDKENKKEKKKRRHSKDEGHGDKAGRPKRNRKAGDEEDGPMADEDDYLFVRGASPTGSSSDIPNQGKFFEGEVDAFGRPYDGAEPEFDEENRRRRRSRSPQDRRRGGNRRPNSGRKEVVKPNHKSDQICAYYMQGKCQKSHEECAFSHNAVPPRKMELCKFWMMECCAKKEKCLYLHNDFPCKYYHTGLVCKLGLRNQCKFSHKPLNEVTKAVLLKHIETAPKEILGDFPRLNRHGALNLIAKMEAKINRELERMERAKQAESEKQRKASAGKERDDDHRRRSRWEQPTHEDEVKLHSLMEEAGIENYYSEAVSDVPSQNQSPPRKPVSQNPQHQKMSQQHQQNHHKQNHNSNPNFSMIGMNPMLGMGNMSMLPNQLPTMLPGQSPIVNNPALASVLANLQIPSTTIQHPPPKQDPGYDQSLEEGHVSQYQQLGKLKEQQSKMSHNNNNTKQHPRSPSRRSATPPPLTIVQDSVKVKVDEIKSEPPEHLPPMQKELFRRIQEQQIKNEKKSQDPESDEEKPDDHGWYSSDEETEKSVPEPKPIEKQEVKPVVDFASVLSAIRQKTAAAQSKESSDKANSIDSNLNLRQESSPPRGRGDVDLRYNTQPGVGTGTTGQGPFGDTDFRLPSLRPEFKDIDLRLGSGGSPGQPDPGRVSPVAPVFKSMPTGPATMIDASLNSHPPIIWKVHIAAGVRKPDYNYIRHTLTPNQMQIDPRFGPRTAGGISILPDPSSPPPVTTNIVSPATIPVGDLDPRVRRGQAQGQQSQQAHGDPRFGRDPRSGGQQAQQQQQQQQQNMLPPGWPTTADMTQAAIQQAAQFMAAQQLGLPLLSFPNPGGLPFPPPPDFGASLGGNTNIPGSGRPPFHGQGQFPGQNQFLGRPPSSSWERMQSSGGVTPPL